MHNPADRGKEYNMPVDLENMTEKECIEWMWWYDRSTATDNVDVPEWAEHRYNDSDNAKG